VKILFFILLFVGFPFLSFSAEPSISGVEGSISNGQTITITGSNYGSKTTPGPRLSSYDNSTSSNNFSTGSIGGEWEARGDTIIGNSESWQRTALYQEEYYSNHPWMAVGYADLAFDADLSDGVYWYTSIWYQVTEDEMCVSASSHNAKFWRWYTATDTSSGRLSENFTSSNVPGVCSSGEEVTGNNVGTDYGNGDGIDYHFPHWPLGEWFHHEVWVYAGTSGNSDGRYREKINGKEVRDWTGWGLINSHSINAWRFGQVSGMNYVDGGPGSILTSGLYIDTTQSHVFISDRKTISSDWLDASTESVDEVQVASSWSDTSITITVNQGSLNGTKYLYVVNSSGEVNTSGYEVTFDGPQASDGSQSSGITSSGVTIGQ
jgi:hypothetical protein